MLDKLNSTLKPAVPEVREPIPEPPSLPVIHPRAMHNSPYVTTGGTAIGTVPKPTQTKRRGERGPDKLGPNKKRRARRACGLCKEKSPSTMHNCNGSGGQKKCAYWNLDRTRKIE